MWIETLTSQEADFTQQAIDILASVPWARPLLRRLEKKGGVCSANMPLLFEVRIAYALHCGGSTVMYERKTGSRQRVDFYIQGRPGWLIEAVSLRESAAIKAATHESGDLCYLHLSSLAEDPKQSEEGEIIKAIERIAETGKQFREPSSDMLHVIVADVRGYVGGDQDDYREIVYGTEAASPEHSHWWQGRPIFGLFDSRNPTVAAQRIQQRVHFVGLLRERKYCEGEIQSTGFYLPNPMFFPDRDSAERAFATYPLRPFGR